MDIIVLGAGGKMGPTLCVLAKKAADMAGVTKKIYAVSRNDRMQQKSERKNCIFCAKVGFWAAEAPDHSR